MFIINGQIDKADGNFASNFFVQQVGIMNIYLGACPAATADDIYQLR